MPHRDAQPEPPASGPARSSAWLSRFGLDVRPHECAVCFLLFGVHFLLLAFQYIGKSLRQSSYIDALGAEQLPGVYLAVALLSYPVLLLYGRLVRQFRLDRLLALLTLLSALVTAGFGEWFRRVEGTDGFALASIALYLWTAVVAILLVSLFWSLSSQVLDARQARRLFGFLGAGGLLGSIAGGQMARVGSLWGGAAGALYLGAGLLVLCSFSALFFGRRFGQRCETRAEDEVPATPVGASEPDEQVDVALRRARDGMGTVLRSRYLRRVSLLMLLAATVAQVVDLQFGWAVEGATSTLYQRTAAFGNLYSAMGLAAFLFQLLFTARIHRRLGVGFALRVLPVTNGLGAAAFLAAAFFAPALVLPVLWLVKAAENGIRYSLDQATRELLFVPVPEDQRPRAKAFVDVFMQRAAKGLAALLLLSVTFGWISVPATAWIALGCVVAWLGILGTLQRHYVAGFRDGLVRRLLSGQGTAGDDLRLDLRDGATLETLVAGLGSADAREVRHSVELLDGHGRGHLVPPVMLAHDSAEVRLAVLGVLRRGLREEAEPWVERLLADPEPPVRVAAIRTLAALSSEDLRTPMEARLQDPDPRVRGVAASYLATLDDPDLLSLADSSLADMLADPGAEVRIEAARALAELEEPRFQTGIVQLLYDPDVRVVRAALAAVRDRTLRGEGNPLYVPTVVSLLHRRRLKHEAREALAAYGEKVMPPLRHFLLDSQEPIWVRRGLPKTIAKIGGEGAMRVLCEALDAADSFQRRKVVEALTSLYSGGSGMLRPDPALLDDRIAAESREYLRHQLDLWSLESVAGAEATSHLLPRLLSDRLERQKGLVFGLLALRQPDRDIATARRGLRSERPSVRAHALEYLDNLLDGEVRQWVLALLDDLPRADLRKQAQRLFGLEAQSPQDTLRRLATHRTPGDADAAWLTAAALHFIQQRKVEELAPLIQRAAERDRNALVRETAGVLLRWDSV